MKDNQQAIASFSFDQQSPPAVQLLALSLELRTLLKSNPRLTAYIPFEIYQNISANSFQELIFDTLSPLYTDLEKRLSLRVHKLPTFEIKSN